MNPQTAFNLDGQVAVVTGGAGVLCSAMARGLSQSGAKIALLGRTLAKLETVATDIQEAGGEAIAVQADVTSREALEIALQTILDQYGRVDILINGAGGNHPAATTNDEQSFFGLPVDGVNFVFDVNMLGTFLPCQVFGNVMAQQESGTIINISSMAAEKPLTRVPVYAAAKAGINSLTYWLSTYMAQECSPNIRVNAIAPGFFVGQQNRRLLLDENDTPTPRGQSIIDHTPMGRFGDPEDLVGTTIWLASPASKFVTGIVVPVDGGFSAFGGI